MGKKNSENDIMKLVRTDETYRVGFVRAWQKNARSGAGLDGLLNDIGQGPMATRTGEDASKRRQRASQVAAWLRERKVGLIDMPRVTASASGIDFASLASLTREEITETVKAPIPTDVSPSAAPDAAARMSAYLASTPPVVVVRPVVPAVQAKKK